MDDIAISGGDLVEVFSNHIASLRSKLGNIEKHKMGNALSGRKRFALERMEELERVMADLGGSLKARVGKRIDDLLKE